MSDKIWEFDDSLIDSRFFPVDTSNFEKRNSSRGIVILNKKMALLNVVRAGYHKLPGGGFEGDETPTEAFKREILEETGCNCEILDPVGIVVEKRYKFKLIQTSYVYVAKVVGDPGEPHFDKGEIELEFKLEWVTLMEAEKIFTEEKPVTYEGKFINARDKAIFQYFTSMSFSRVQ